MIGLIIGTFIYSKSINVIIRLCIKMVFLCSQLWFKLVVLLLQDTQRCLFDLQYVFLKEPHPFYLTASPLVHTSTTLNTARLSNFRRLGWGTFAKRAAGITQHSTGVLLGFTVVQPNLHLSLTEQCGKMMNLGVCNGSSFSVRNSTELMRFSVIVI